MTRNQPRSATGADSTSDPVEQDHEALLSVLNDPKSRAILRETTGRTLTARELSDTLDLPLSTVYRKLDRLVDTSLVEETSRLKARGRHPSQYHCAVDRVRVQMSDAGEPSIDVAVSRRPKQCPTPGQIRD